MDTWMADVGGASYNPGTGMPVHVSCSLNFIAQDGWDNEGKVKYGGRPNGPVQGLDTEWHVVQYIGARWEVSTGAQDANIETFLKHGCNYAFTPVTSSFLPSIRLSD